MFQVSYHDTENVIIAHESSVTIILLSHGDKNIGTPKSLLYIISTHSSVTSHTQDREFKTKFVVVQAILNSCQFVKFFILGLVNVPSACISHQALKFQSLLHNAAPEEDPRLSQKEFANDVQPNTHDVQFI